MVQALIFDYYGVVRPDNIARLAAGAPIHDRQLLDIIVSLRSEGYKTGLLSNAYANTIETNFAPNELHKYFDAVLVSGDVDIAKPDPQIYRMMADKLGAKTINCVMIDDREEHCQGARAAGMQAILYRDAIQFTAELSKLLG